MERIRVYNPELRPSIEIIVKHRDEAQARVEALEKALEEANAEMSRLRKQTTEDADACREARAELRAHEAVLAELEYRR